MKPLQQATEMTATTSLVARHTDESLIAETSCRGLGVVRDDRLVQPLHRLRILFLAHRQSITQSALATPIGNSRRYRGLELSSAGSECTPTEGRRT